LLTSSFFESAVASFFESAVVKGFLIFCFYQKRHMQYICNVTSRALRVMLYGCIFSFRPRISITADYQAWE
jgi:hypothetical protein